VTPSRRRVVVTGVGVICSIGGSQDEYWRNALEGRCGIRPVDLFDPAGCLGNLAGEIDTIPPPPRPADRTNRRASRTDLLCITAAWEALGQAGLAGAADRSGIGVSIGSSTAGMLESEGYCRDGLERGFGLARPSLVLRLPSSTPADAVARAAGAMGPRVSNMTACASSSASIGFAADLIRSGDADVMIAGGGDGLCLMTYAGFNALRLVDPNASRPFDATRQGLSLGEGAGMLVMEDLDHAARRGARPLAEFLEYGSSCDAHHMTAPHAAGRGAAAAMAEALARAGLSPADIGHINAHGTGTPLNDATEARAILAVFGPEGSARIPVTSNKSMIGHLLGGSGGVEAVTLVLSLMHQIVPPTIGWTSSDEGVHLDIVAPGARPVAFEYGFSNSFGFGGTNCALLFRRAS